MPKPKKAKPCLQPSPKKNQDQKIAAGMSSSIGDPAAAGLGAAPLAQGKNGAKLDEVATQIKRETALREQEAAEKKRQEDLKLNPALPSPLAPAPGFNFELSPAFKKVGSGVAFYVLSWVVQTFFKRGVKPLTDKQQSELEAAVDKLAQKYLPQVMSKFMSEHQQESDIVCVMAGIGFENSIPLVKQEETPPAPQKAPTLPPTPEAEVTVITAEAPPLTGAK